MDYLNHAKKAALKGDPEIWLQKDVIKARYGCTCTFESKLISLLRPHKLRVAFMWGLGAKKASVLRFRPTS